MELEKEYIILVLFLILFVIIRIRSTSLYVTTPRIAISTPVPATPNSDCVYTLSPAPGAACSAACGSGTIAQIATITRYPTGTGAKCPGLLGGPLVPNAPCTGTFCTSTVSYPIMDSYGYQDIDPTVSPWTSSGNYIPATTGLSWTQLNSICWRMNNCVGIRHNFDTKESWYLGQDPTNQTIPSTLSVNTPTVQYQGSLYSLPLAIVALKSQVNPAPCTTTVPSGTYVSSPCTTTSNTVFSPAASCSPSQYVTGYSPGSSTQAGSPGTCNSCATTVPSGTYVSSPCTTTSNTVFSPAASCSPSQYVTGYSPGSSTQAGSPGTCNSCATTVPSGTYVSSPCTTTSNTVFSPAASCSPSQYVTGYSPGSSTQAGSPGSCAPCPSGQTSNGQTTSCQSESWIVYNNDYDNSYYELDPSSGQPFIYFGKIRDAIALTKQMGDAVFWYHSTNTNINSTSVDYFAIISKSKLRGNESNILVGDPGAYAGYLWFISGSTLPPSTNSIVSPVTTITGTSIPDIMYLSSKNSSSGGNINTITLPNLTTTAGSASATVRIRGTSLTLAVSGVSNADIYAQFASNYTGTLILEKTDGTALSTQTISNAQTILFSAVKFT